MDAVGTKIFTVRSGWLEVEGSRLDASAYATGAVAVRNRLLSGSWRCRPLGQLAELFNGPRFRRHYVRDSRFGTPFLSSSDILLADLRDLPLLSPAATPNFNALLVEQGWSLISCSGTIGNTAYVRSEMAGMAASQHVMRVVPHPGEVLPGYLFAFLSSGPGQVLIKSRTYGSIVQHIEPQHIADLPVPVASAEFQDRIHGLVARAASARSEARRLLDEASNFFDGLVGPMPSTHEHAFAVGIVGRRHLERRLDSFHHVGWAAEAGSVAGTPLGCLGRVSRPGMIKRVFVERGVPFVSGIDVYQVRASFRQRIMQIEAERADCQIQAHELLVQRGGQRYGLLGRPAYAGKRLSGWAASEDLIHVALHDKGDAGRVFAFLRGEVGRRALLRTSYGTSIPKLNPEGLLGLLIPPTPVDIAARANRALELREQADEDEESAIREVEAWLV